MGKNGVINHSQCSLENAISISAKQIISLWLTNKSGLQSLLTFGSCLRTQVCEDSTGPTSFSQLSVRGGQGWGQAKVTFPGRSML